MKKIIVSIFVIGLLLNTAPLCMGREEAVDGASFDVRKSFRHATRDDFDYIDSGKLYDGIDEEIVGLLPTPPKPIRSIAEFEPMQSVLISYTWDLGGFGISYDIIAEMAEDVEQQLVVKLATGEITNEVFLNAVNLLKEQKKCSGLMGYI